MATSGSFSTSFNNGLDDDLKWVFGWKIDSTGTGTSTVEWTLTTVGRTSSSTNKWYATECTATLSEVSGGGTISPKGQLYASGAISATSEAASFVDKLRASGTFTITHTNSGSGKFKIKLKGRIWDHKYDLQEDEEEFTLDTNYPYQSCSAPTTLTCSPSIQKPNGTVTLTWSGAEAGAGVTISGYCVERQTASGDWSVVHANIASSPATYTIPGGETRGQYIKFRVKAISSVTGYDSAFKESSATACRVNVKPDKPTVTANFTTVPSGSTNRPTITVSAGSVGDTGQTAELYYAKGTGSFSKFTGSTLSVTDSQTVEYKFKTYDGLEYSDESPITIYFNGSAPTVTAPSLTRTILSTSQTKPTGATYATKFTATTTASGGSTNSGNNTYTFTLYRGSTGTPRTKVCVLQSSSSNTLNIEDIRAYYTPTTAYYYAIGVTVNDGVETSSEAYSSATWVSGVPTCSMDCDSKATDLTGYFSNHATISCVEDEGYNRFYIEATSLTGSVLFSQTVNGAKASGRMVALVDLSSLSRGRSYIFKIKPVCPSFSPSSYSLTTTKTRIFLGSLDSISLTGTIYPYTSTGKNLSFRNFLQGIQSVAEQNRKQYGLAGTTSFSLSASLNGKTNTITKDYTWASLSAPSSSSTLYWSISKTNFQTLFNGLGINVNSSNETTVPMTLFFKNDCGDLVSSSFSVQVCYVTDDTQPVIKTLNYNVSTAQGKPVVFLAETCLAGASGTFGGYHNIVEAEFQLGTPDNKTEFFSVFKPLSCNVSNGGGSFTLSGVGIDQIIYDYSQISLRVRIKNSAGQWSEWKGYDTLTNKDGNTLTAKKLIAPSGSLQDCSWSLNESGGYIEASFQATDLGYTESLYDSFTARLYQDNTPLNYHFFQNQTSSATALTPITREFAALESWDGLNSIRLKVRMTARLYPTGDMGDTAVEKTADTIFVLVHKDVATMSYRKNKIGINFPFSTNVCSDGALVVKAHNNQKYVYLTDGANNTASIGLVGSEFGVMTNFIIDCGQWT